MGEVTFILGGARSGKSEFAVNLAKATAKPVLFVATACAGDSEMKKRIFSHRRNRPRAWCVLEEEKEIFRRLTAMPDKFGVILIDCLTVYISNLLLDNKTGRYIRKEVADIFGKLKMRKSDGIAVANEVGFGIVPDNALARRFRDLAGEINQLAAKFADTVYFVAAGLPVKMK